MVQADRWSIELGGRYWICGPTFLSLTASYLRLGCELQLSVLAPMPAPCCHVVPAIRAFTSLKLQVKTNFFFKGYGVFSQQCKGKYFLNRPQKDKSLKCVLGEETPKLLPWWQLLLDNSAGLKCAKHLEKEYSQRRLWGAFRRYQHLNGSLKRKILALHCG